MLLSKWSMGIMGLDKKRDREGGNANMFQIATVLVNYNLGL